MQELFFPENLMAQSPLWVAIYKQYPLIAEKLLHHFPELVSLPGGEWEIKRVNLILKSKRWIII